MKFNITTPKSRNTLPDFRSCLIYQARLIFILGTSKSAAGKFDRVLKPWLEKSVTHGDDSDSAPRGIRTHDPRFRRPVLLSAEL
jgi:hypothetical protein